MAPRKKNERSKREGKEGKEEGQGKVCDGVRKMECRKGRIRTRGLPAVWWANAGFSAQAEAEGVDVESDAELLLWVALGCGEASG